jgi:hypothetical protein
MRRASDPLLSGLVDDAALFPPGNAPMHVALAEHARYRAAPWAAAIGPFLCPASRAGELVSALPSDQQIALSLVLGPADGDTWQTVVKDARITLVAIEAADGKPADDLVAALAAEPPDPGVRRFLEVPRTGFGKSLDRVDGAAWNAAKYRTGGTAAEAFPTDAELAAFLGEVAARDLPFKLTAGLHHAVRATTPEGFEAHGVLNVLVATRVALAGGSAADVTTVLGERLADPLLEFVAGWDEDACTGVRRAFRSFGCCGVTDPLGELAALGLLDDFS